jgi:HD-like signal output (HDOD) protein
MPNRKTYCCTRRLGVLLICLTDADITFFVERYYVRAGALLANIWQLPEVVGQVIINHSEVGFKGENGDVILNVQAALDVTAGGEEDGLSDELQQSLNFYDEELTVLEEKRQVVNSWVETVDV